VADRTSLRILHVIRGLANSSGTTHIVGPLSEAQARLGHTVRVFFVDKPGRAPVVPDPTLVESTGFPMTVSTRQAGWSRSFARALPRAVREANVVHVHAIWNFPTWWTMREALRAGVPYVVAPQGSLEDWALRRSRCLKSLYARIIERPYFDRALAMQALTETEAEQCRRFGIKAPVMVLPNGVDLAAIDRSRRERDLRAELSLPRTSVLFLFLGRVFPKKGLDLLVPAFAKLCRETAHAHLLIAGDDAGSGYLGEVDRLVQANGAAGRIHLLGEVAGNEKFDTLRNADAFVLSSYSEGLPVAALEAMACRLPVILTHNCNLADIETHEAGWLVEPRTDDVLRALRAALSSVSERQRRGENARTLVERRYTWSRIADESISFYRSLPLSTN